MDREPHVKPVKDVIKIFGKTNDPRFQNSIIVRGSQTKSQHFNAKEGRAMTNKEVQDKLDEIRQMRNFPRELVIEHRTEKGKEDVRLKLDYKTQR